MQDENRRLFWENKQKSTAIASIGKFYHLFSPWNSTRLQQRSYGGIGERGLLAS